MTDISSRALMSALSAIATIATLSVSASAQRPPAPPPFVPGRLLVQFKPTASDQQTHALLDSARSQVTATLPRLGVHILQLPPQVSEIALARAFAQRPEVAFAEVDRIRAPDFTPNDPTYASEWHLPKISAPTAWDTTTGSGSIIIAILDTGVDATHPDLAAKMVAGWNFFDNTNNTADVFGHGTAVAGTAAAAGNNGVGVTSLAWGCKLMPLRISDASGYAYYSTAANALTWAADHGARVANLSYEMSDSAAVSSAAQYFQGKGGVVTISSGNATTFDASADNPYVLTVSATDGNDALASWSNTGNNVDLSAPGVSIYTTMRGGGYGAWTGTSFSAPIVAGVAALVLSVNPALSGAQAQSLLKNSADDRGGAGWDSQYGWGRVNAARAVSLALNTGGADTTPPNVSFKTPTAGTTMSGMISVQANAGDNVAVSSVTFYVDGVAQGSAATSPYAFAWNSLSAANGAHTLKLLAADASGNSSSTEMSININNTTDISLPVVSITSPTGGKIGNSLTVSAVASDNVGVVRVELWVDGKLTLSDAAAPWTFAVNTRKWPVGLHTLQCKAYDAIGNAGSSQIVTITR